MTVSGTCPGHVADSVKDEQDILEQRLGHLE